MPVSRYLWLIDDAFIFKCNSRLYRTGFPSWNLLKHSRHMQDLNLESTILIARWKTITILMTNS